MRRRLLPWLGVVAVLALSACGSAPKKQGPSMHGGAGKQVAGGKNAHGKPPAGCPEGSPYAAAQEDPSTRGDYVAGGLYKPGVRDTTPEYVPNVACIPEPLVVDEPRSPVGNRSPYTVLGKQYRVLERPHGYVEQGTASYYGAKFHGRRTSNQEVYDMYAFTAAHKTLPLPSFARVTNLDNGESVVVRVNDRGPFHEGRVVDLSYAAAVRLGIVQRGTGRVEVRALQPGDADAPVAGPRRRGSAPVAAAPTRAAPAAASTAPATPATAMDQLVQALPAAAPGALLQVASFSSQDNAQRALQRLLAAGIAGARLDDATSGGRPLWRLRVASAGVDAAELAGRIAGLGFGTPQLVRE
ncbi:septal ring lytic transglycosylase RlpA family protein [Xanthomonas sp. XNM01]|uniref:septal ring lytic transglycosylase RlpA family protein n=1 Tax=Xanthomonas sp. XNM01 TaxID=2769289 RepID=UPI00178606BE|nr:septal ring lytic transglycosylase RlpA family protein [Xanthomonas sp. XNM01]MBD9370019.1 septal ring lytic transglycosylase RlpA family protein [Xanthomonas sp. XNM01]